MLEEADAALVEDNAADGQVRAARCGTPLRLDGDGSNDEQADGKQASAHGDLPWRLLRHPFLSTGDQRGCTGVGHGAREQGD